MYSKFQSGPERVHVRGERGFPVRVASNEILNSKHQAKHLAAAWT